MVEKSDSERQHREKKKREKANETKTNDSKVFKKQTLFPLCYNKVHG